MASRDGRGWFGSLGPGSWRTSDVRKVCSRVSAVLFCNGVAYVLMGAAQPLAAQILPSKDGQRGIALTFDDLPGMSAMTMSAASITGMNRAIVAELLAERVPAIGFVNEIRLYKTGEVDARIAVLKAWLDAGIDLGNHTYSHTSLSHTELRDWEDDVVQGESVTRILLAEHRKQLRYFRHPYLDVGPDLLTRRQAEKFLTARGYRIAPVTIDPLDWYFADLYDDARQHSDRAGQDRIVQAWLTYAGQAFADSEERSRTLLGYEPKQVLLLHDTWLEADHLRDLLALIRARGYRLIPLDEALKDAAYAQPDEYISDVGATWIEHWAVTRGRLSTPAQRPKLPDWIEKRHAALDAAGPQ